MYMTWYLRCIPSAFPAPTRNPLDVAHSQVPWKDERHVLVAVKLAQDGDVGVGVAVLSLGARRRIPKVDGRNIFTILITCLYLTDINSPFYQFLNILQYKLRLLLTW